MKGLILEGGGARGAYQAGALKAIAEIGITFDGVAGTSIGSLNGALIVQDSLELLLEMWQKVNLSMLFDIDAQAIQNIQERNLAWNDIHAFFAELRSFVLKRGLDASRIKQLIIDLIDEDKIRNSGKDFGIVTYSLSDFKPMELYLEDIPVGKLSEYLMASANFPAFRLEKLDGKYLVDGGVYNNLPINMLLQKGYTDLIVLRIFGIGLVKKVKQQNANIMEICPSEDLGHMLDFNPARIQYNLSLGYFDTYKAMQNLLGNRYYVRIGEKAFFEKHILTVTKRQILHLQHLCDLHGANYQRIFLEEILPHIAKLLNLTRAASYQQLIVALLETAADYVQLERFKIYDLGEFKQVITTNCRLVIWQNEYTPLGKQYFDKHHPFSKEEHLAIFAAFIYLGLNDVELARLKETLSL